MPANPPLLEGLLPPLLLWALALGWLTTVAVLHRKSRLPEHHKWWANLLSIFPGPLGWLYHYAGERRWIRNPRLDDAEPQLAGLEAEAVQPKRSKLRLAFGGLGLGTQQPEPPSETETVRRLLLAAVEQETTDIHFEPHGADYVARFRVNGLLREQARFPLATGERVLSAIKVMAGMDIADRHRMQDGRLEWSAREGSPRIDLRLSTSPTLGGEKLAIRFLNRQLSSRGLEELGMPEDLLAAVRRTVRHNEGLVLVAGPTGSGKTSTAYSVLQFLAGPGVNTMTIEDPVEYSLPYATQIGVNAKAGITFETGLKTLLRQDPNVIFVGEMRDPESFRIGIRASLSGHLVVTTMHARDAVGVMTTLRNLGIDKETLSSALKLVISQRLVRVLCPHCSLPVESLDADAAEFLGDVDASQVRSAARGGCPNCFHSGFSARIGIFEYLKADQVVQDWLASNRSESSLREELRQHGRPSLREHARQRVLAGEVDVLDAIRAVGWEES